MSYLSSLYCLILRDLVLFPYLLVHFILYLHLFLCQSYLLIYFLLLSDFVFQSGLSIVLSLCVLSEIPSVPLPTNISHGLCVRVRPVNMLLM